jgi:hypothetical protein
MPPKPPSIARLRHTTIFDVDAVEDDDLTKIHRAVGEGLLKSGNELVAVEPPANFYCSARSRSKIMIKGFLEYLSHRLSGSWVTSDPIIRIKKRRIRRDSEHETAYKARV